MKKSNMKTELKSNSHPKQINSRETYYDNLARVSSTLLAGLVALLMFLLLVGAQGQIKGFTGPLYVTFIVLGVSLVFYVLGNMTADANNYLVHKTVEAKASRKQQKTTRAVPKLLTAARVLHQVAFVVGVGMVVYFAINFSQLVINPKPVQQTSAASQNVPAPTGESQEQIQQETQQGQQ